MGTLRGRRPAPGAGRPGAAGATSPAWSFGGNLRGRLRVWFRRRGSPAPVLDPGTSALPRCHHVTLAGHRARAVTASTARDTQGTAGPLWPRCPQPQGARSVLVPGCPWFPPALPNNLPDHGTTSTPSISQVSQSLVPRAHRLPSPPSIPQCRSPRVWTAGSRPGRRRSHSSGRGDRARLGPARLSKARLSRARLSSARLSSDQPNKARPGAVGPGPAPHGPVRLGSARLGSARAGPAPVAAPPPPGPAAAGGGGSGRGRERPAPAGGTAGLRGRAGTGMSRAGTTGHRDRQGTARDRHRARDSQGQGWDTQGPGHPKTRTGMGMGHPGPGQPKNRTGMDRGHPGTSQNQDRDGDGTSRNQDRDGTSRDE